jgi:hypothetical protein
MVAKFGGLMWGANVTSSTNVLKFQRAAVVKTATLDTSAVTFADWIPAGNASTDYDLLKNLADAMNAGDPAQNYTVALQTDSVTGMTGKITIANTAAFEILWSNAATTVDPAWFGFAPAACFRETGYTYTDSTAASSYTGTHSSSLLWFPQKQAAFHDYQIGGHARVVQTRSLDGANIRTHRFSVRNDFPTYTVTAMTNHAALGGRGRMEWQNVDESRIHPSTSDTDKNRSLLMWWAERASQGKWFLACEDNAAPGFSTATRFRLARCSGEVLEDFGAVIRKRPEAAPQLWTVDIPLIAVASGECSAGGA